MGLPGWSTTEPTVIGDLTLLPRGVRWTSNPDGVIADLNTNVTTGGERYTTLFFERELHELTVRFPASEKAQFRAMYTAGRADDIYYVPDSDDMSTVHQVRFEEPNFLPRNVGDPGGWFSEGTMQMWFDWTFTISTAPGEVLIDD